MTYDLIVIGSGSAAFAAGIEARSLGASDVLVEQAVLGGTCVNVGCVPSKTLLAAAGVAATARSHPYAGVPTSVGPVDLAALVAQQDELVSGLRQAKYADVAAAHGIELLPPPGSALPSRPPRARQGFLRRHRPDLNEGDRNEARLLHTRTDDRGTSPNGGRRHPAARRDPLLRRLPEP